MPFRSPNDLDLASWRMSLLLHRRKPCSASSKPVAIKLESGAMVAHCATASQAPPVKISPPSWNSAADAQKAWTSSLVSAPSLFLQVWRVTVFSTILLDQGQGYFNLIRDHHTKREGFGWLLPHPRSSESPCLAVT